VDQILIQMTNILRKTTIIATTTTRTTTKMTIIMTIATMKMIIITTTRTPKVSLSHNDQPTQTTSDVQTTNSRTTETCTTCSSTSGTSSMTSSSSTGTATRYIIYPSDSHNTAVFQSKLDNAVPSASVSVSQDNRLGLLWWWTRLTRAQVNSLKDSSVRHTGSFD